MIQTSWKTFSADTNENNFVNTKEPQRSSHINNLGDE